MPNGLITDNKAFKFSLQLPVLTFEKTQVTLKLLKVNLKLLVFSFNLRVLTSDPPKFVAYSLNNPISVPQSCNTVLDTSL